MCVVERRTSWYGKDSSRVNREWVCWRVRDVGIKASPLTYVVPYLVGGFFRKGCKSVYSKDKRRVFW